MPGEVAQWLRRLTADRKVSSSSPALPTLAPAKGERYLKPMQPYGDTYFASQKPQKVENGNLTFWLLLMECKTKLLDLDILYKKVVKIALDVPKTERSIWTRSY